MTIIEAVGLTAILSVVATWLACRLYYLGIRPVLRALPEAAAAVDKVGAALEELDRTASTLAHQTRSAALSAEPEVAEALNQRAAALDQLASQLRLISTPRTGRLQRSDSSPKA